MTLVDAAASGDERKALEALRDELAVMLAQCDSPRDYAALSLRFMDCVERITLLGDEVPEQKGTALDEFSRRLAERRSRASG